MLPTFSLNPTLGSRGVSCQCRSTEAGFPRILECEGSVGDCSATSVTLLPHTQGHRARPRGRVSEGICLPLNKTPLEPSPVESGQEGSVVLSPYKSVATSRDSK